jgi:hypothetical protein
MKTHRAVLRPLLAAAAIMIPALAIAAADDALPQELTCVVPVELGEAEFSPGDSITIQSVLGTQTSIVSGGTYCVTGTYTLSSRPAADLALFLTTKNTAPSPTPIDPRQTVRIQKGSGAFSLVTTISAAGYPHLSFYPVPGGSSFGGVYFGQGQWVLRQKGFKYLDKSADNEQAPAAAIPGNLESVPAQNRAILEYLGGPVMPPAWIEKPYTRQGLSDALKAAARNASVTLKHLEIEDSEFPFLVGIICADGDYDKLVDEIKKMPDYEERGGVSTPTCHAINLIPWRVFPSESSQRAGRRLLLREQMFFDRLSQFDRKY